MKGNVPDAEVGAVSLTRRKWKRTTQPEAGVDGDLPLTHSEAAVSCQVSRKHVTGGDTWAKLQQ